MVERDQLAEHLFGPIPAAFFVLLGQTIAAAGLVELKVYDLVTSLDRVEQHVHAGQPLSRVRAALPIPITRDDSRICPSAK
jgi:hypothetical protein